MNDEPTLETPEWIGVDMDGTLAEYHGWCDTTEFGKPIPAMLERVKAWLAQGEVVRIFTARVASTNPRREETIEAVRRWTLEHVGVALEATAEKNWRMKALWDDRCVAVEYNTGRQLSPEPSRIRH